MLQLTVNDVNTKTVAVVALFAALTIVLNFSPLKIPAPYAPFLIYQVWEIPIVAALLLFGTVTAILIGFMNTAILIAVYPGALPTGPLYNLAAVLSMLVGILVMKTLIKRHPSKHEVLFVALLTVSGTLLRTVMMVLANWALLRFPSPVGYSMPEAAIIATIPLVAFFNATLASYTIPAGYSLTKAAEALLKTAK